MKDPTSGYFLWYLVCCSQVPHMVISESVLRAGAMSCTALDSPPPPPRPQRHSTECRAWETVLNSIGLKENNKSLTFQNTYGSGNLSSMSLGDVPEIGDISETQHCLWNLEQRVTGWFIPLVQSIYTRIWGTLWEMCGFWKDR